MERTKRFHRLFRLIGGAVVALAMGCAASAPTVDIASQPSGPTTRPAAAVDVQQLAGQVVAAAKAELTASVAAEVDAKLEATGVGGDLTGYRSEFGIGATIVVALSLLVVGALAWAIVAALQARASSSGRHRAAAMLLAALACATAARGANVSFGFAGSGANDAGTGDVSWTSPGNATISDDSLATCAVATGAPNTQWLVATNVQWSIAIPSGATITGIMAIVEQATSTGSATVAEARLVKAGARVGDDLAASQSVFTTWTRTGKYGEETSLCGTTWSATDFDPNFGIALRFSRGSADQTLRVDAVSFFVFWTKTPAATITLGKATTPMAPCAIHAHVTDSYIGTSDWEKVGVRWTITGPSGWTQTATDWRPGSWGASRDRNCATHMWGYNVAIWADVAGTYTLACTIYLEDGSTLTDSENVVVAADTRAVRYVDNTDGTDDPNHGTLSGAGAWKTLDYAFGHAANDMTLVVSDDETWSVTTAVTNRRLTSKSNVIIRRSGGGTNKPRVTMTGSNVEGVELLSCTDCAVVGLDFRGDGTNLNPAFGGGCYNSTRLSIVDCDSQLYRSSFAEISESGTVDQLLVLRGVWQGIKRYAVYIGGSYGRDVVVIGTKTVSDSSTGEGHWRFAGICNVAGYGQRVNLLWAWPDSNGLSHPFLRSGWAWTHSYQCFAEDGVWGTSEQGGGDNTSLGLQVFKRYDGWNVQTSRALSAGDRAMHLFVCNTVFQGALAANVDEWFVPQILGRYRHTEFANCAFLTNYDVDRQMFGFDGTSYPHHESRSWRIVGNVFAMADDGDGDLSSWGSAWIRDGSSSTPFLNSTCVVKNNGYSYTGATKWRWAGTPVALAAWNALTEVSGEFEVKSGDVLVPSDLVSAANYVADANTFPSLQTACTPEPGVWVDYRGILRDPNAATWAVGVTGLESESSQRQGPMSLLPVVATPIVGAAVVAAGWMLWRGRRFVDTGD